MPAMTPTASLDTVQYAETTQILLCIFRSIAQPVLLTPVTILERRTAG